jgi:hypothetical protein
MAVRPVHNPFRPSIAGSPPHPPALSTRNVAMLGTDPFTTPSRTPRSCIWCRHKKSCSKACCSLPCVRRIPFTFTLQPAHSPVRRNP